MARVPASIMEEGGREVGSPRAAVLFGAGFAAGVTITGLLNPVDRALFLGVAKKRPFLHPHNWHQPFQGVGQSLISRAIST